MKILLMMVVAQFLTLVVFAWFNRVAWIRILTLRQQLAVYKDEAISDFRGPRAARPA